MSEPTQDDNQTGADNAMKTVLDLEVEKLKGEVADLRAKYEASILEYQNANKELWAMAHSQQVTQPVVTQQVEQPREPSVEGFVKQFKQE